MDKKDKRQKIDVLEDSPKGLKEELPFESVPLPSEGKLYPEDHPLYGEKSIDIKAMTPEEEDILASAPLIRKGTVVDKLIQSCILNKSIDPDQLLVGDKAAILVAIRISGFGSEYKVKTSCPDCEEIFPHSFNLSKCRIKKLGADPMEPGKNLFKYTLSSGTDVLFKLLTAGDERDILETQEQRRRAFKKHSEGASEISTNIRDRLIKSIVSFGGEKEKVKIVEKIRKTRTILIRPLREYIKSIEPDIAMVEEVECPRCGVREEHDIPMGIEFLWPKRD